MIEALWPHLEPSAGAANLRKAAHHVRQVLGDDAIVLGRGQVALFPGRGIDIDVETYERDAAGALRVGDAEVCSQVADRWGGDLLPDAAYEDWSQTRRNHVRRLQGELLKTARRWKELVALDPTEEDAYRELMREALDRGSRAAAIRWYSDLRWVLASELGVGPAPTTEALYAECLEGIVSHAPELVGRSREIAAIEALLVDDTRELFGAVLVRGRAGIGKTTLCQEAAALARSRDWAVHEVRIDEEATPYAAVIEVIENVLGDGRRPLESVAAHARSVLAALCPSFVAADPLPGALTRHQVIGALQQLLVAAAAGQRVLLVVDDVHLADDASVQVLSHMAATVRNVLVVLGTRAGRGGALDREIRRLDRAGVLITVELGPLDDAAIISLVRSVVDEEVDDEFVDRVVERSEGNPLIAAQLARSADPDVLSAPIADVLTARLANVGPTTAAVLRRVGLVADEFDSNTIVALTGDSVEAAWAVLDEALDAGVLVVERGVYRFQHHLVRETLREQIPPHQRTAVHRDAARRLIAVGASAATIARQWLLADEPAEAVEWSLAAASQAMALGAFSDARRHVDSVLDHDPANPRALRIDAEALDLMGSPKAVRAYGMARSRPQPPPIRTISSRPVHGHR